MSTEIKLLDADRIQGLLSANAQLNQRVVDLEIVTAALRRTLVEKEVADVAKGEAGAKSDKPGKV
jgi:hypothetical protein